MITTESIQEENFNLDNVSCGTETDSDDCPVAADAGSSPPVLAHIQSEASTSFQASDTNRYSARDVHTFFASHPQDSSCRQCVFCKYVQL